MKGSSYRGNIVRYMRISFYDFWLADVYENKTNDTIKELNYEIKQFL